MSKAGLALLFAVATLASLSFADRPEGVKPSMVILGPEKLREEFAHQNYQVEISVANYGYVPYGGSITGSLKTANNLIGEKGCGDPDVDNAQGTINNPTDDNVIVMTQRGDCFFVTKTLNVQNIGGSVAMIVDDKDEENTKIIMTGESDLVHIPSILIKRYVGEIFADFMSQNPGEEIDLFISFPIPHPDDRVEYDIYMLSTNIEIMQFLKEFSQYNTEFDKSTLMTPHYVIYTCPQCHKEGFKNSYVDCISGGRYCAPDPDNEGLYTGFDVVMENLRQLCIYETAKDKVIHREWWDYVTTFYDDCMAPDLEEYHKTHIKTFKDFSQKCSDAVMKKVGIDSAAVEQCVNQSFQPVAVEKDGYGMNKNSVMESEARQQLAAGVYYHPLVRINEKNIRGDITVDLVMNALCGGFDHLPQVCPDYWNQENLNRVDSNPIETTTKEHVFDNPGLSASTIILIVLGCIVFALVLLFCIKRKMALDMNRQINDELHHVVSQYQSLGDDKFDKKAEKRSLVQASRV